jgi:hypothetical protein
VPVVPPPVLPVPLRVRRERGGVVRAPASSGRRGRFTIPLASPASGRARAPSVSPIRRLPAPVRASRRSVKRVRPSTVVQRLRKKPPAARRLA